MYARAMPISSRTAAESDCACFWVKSARIFEERSATERTSVASTFVSACGITHDAIGSIGALQAPGIVEIVQMGDRLAHGEEGLVRVERPAEKQPEQLAGAELLALQRFLQLREVLLMVILQLRDPGVRAAERLAVRGQHQHVFGQLAVAFQRLEEQAQRIAF